MGVDYDGVGGIGLMCEGRIIDSFIAKGYFTKKEYENYASDSLQQIESDLFAIEQAGNSYCGEVYNYLLIKGENLIEIIENATKFCTEYELSFKDLEPVSDLSVW